MKGLLAKVWWPSSTIKPSNTLEEDVVLRVTVGNETICPFANKLVSYHRQQRILDDSCMIVAYYPPVI